MLFGITTSGRSPSVVRALAAAREMGIVTVGYARRHRASRRIAECDHVLLVPDTETARIQECHIALGHAVLELLEDRLVARSAVSILLTGAAGFIGYHVAQALLARGETVIGVDNLDPYYDVRLKRGPAWRCWPTSPASASSELDIAERDADAGAGRPPPRHPAASSISPPRPACGTRWSIPTPMSAPTSWAIW